MKRVPGRDLRRSRIAYRETGPRRSFRAATTPEKAGPAIRAGALRNHRDGLARIIREHGPRILRECPNPNSQ
jgi:hypothetical protein